MVAQSEVSKPVVAIVVAAGSGIRLGGDIPKALRLVAGRPLVWYAVSKLAAGGVGAAVVVVAAGLTDEFSAVLADIEIPISVVVGGAERQDSVAAGLAAASYFDPDIVLIHDAARAFVPADVVARVIEAVSNGAKSVVPVVPVIDSLRIVDAEVSRVVDRTDFRVVQTPQGFDFETISAAHDFVREYGLSVTDDASACDVAGFETVLVTGDRQAIKVTEPMDLLLAEVLAKGFPCE